MSPTIIDWHARFFVRAGLVRDWDVMVGLAFERRRRDSLDGEDLPSTLLIRILIWWVEVYYKSSEQLMAEHFRGFRDQPPLAPRNLDRG